MTLVALHLRTLALAALGLAMAPGSQPTIVLAENQAGTTLSVSHTAEGHLTRTFGWSIEKAVTPDQWHLFRGDSAVSTFAVRLIKDAGADDTFVSGVIAVDNGGDAATEGLAITSCVEYKSGSGPFLQLLCQPVSLGNQTSIPAHTVREYSFATHFTPIATEQYRSAVLVAITNHSGYLGEPFGPQDRQAFVLPTGPDQVLNDTIHVADSMGQSWTFNTTDRVAYDKSFTCDADRGTFTNTASIRETGASATASVNVSCYALSLEPDVNTSFTRTYDWTVNKVGSQSALTLAVREAMPVDYTVTVSAAYLDSGWVAAGTVQVANPSPIPVTLDSLSLVVSPDLPVTLACPIGLPATLAPGQTLACSYRISLPDAANRNSLLEGMVQNYAYDSQGGKQPAGRTAFSSETQVSFVNATRADVDETVAVTDAWENATTSLGTLTYGSNILPAVYRYSRSIGSYASPGDFSADNTASVRTNDTDVRRSASWRVAVRVPASGCSLTIGYWKTHAGLGPQPDEVTRLLPLSLGTPGSEKAIRVITASQAAAVLSMSASYGDPSNGITKLYAQLLGAKLNMARGADGSAIAQVLSEADRFLATKSWRDWAGLNKPSRQQVMGWASTLDAYNNGLIGPGHCSQ